MPRHRDPGLHRRWRHDRPARHCRRTGLRFGARLRGWRRADPCRRQRHVTAGGALPPGL